MDFVPKAPCCLESLGVRSCYALRNRNPAKFMIRSEAKITVEMTKYRNLQVHHGGGLCHAPMLSYLRDEYSRKSWNCYEYTNFRS